MKIEIVEFYPKTKHDIVKNKLYIGSLHVYLIEENMDIRGVTVLYDKKKKWWYFRLPSRANYDIDEQKFVSFAFVSFTDLKKNSELKQAIIKQGKKYIKENFSQIL